MDPFSLGIVTLLGAGVYRYMRRGKSHRDWAEVVTEAAQQLNGQASVGSRFDSPQLRTTIDGIKLTISLKDTHRSKEKSTIIAEAKIDAKAEHLRLYFGWNIGQLREELTYIPEVELPFNFGLPSPHMVRSNDKAFAQKLLRYSANDIVDVKREAEAHGIEFLLRAGGLRLAIHGIERSEWMIERLATATTRIVKGIHASADSNSSIVTAPIKAIERAQKHNCRLCNQAIHENESLLRCNRCNAGYHDYCWQQATGCFVPDCFETRATPE